MCYTALEKVAKRFETSMENILPTCTQKLVPRLGVYETWCHWDIIVNQRLYASDKYYGIDYKKQRPQI